MFDENFTFDLSRSPSLASSNASSSREPSRSVSPCSHTSPHPPPRFSVTDLATQFSNQRLRKDSQICYDSCEAYAATDDDAGWTIEPCIEQDVESGVTPFSRVRSSMPRPPRPHSPSQRLQRQLNARLLCSTSHHRDIAALVHRMVQANEQCSVSPPEAIATSPTTPTSPEEDEGYDTGNDYATPALAVPPRPRLDYRRSMEFRMTGACVSKSVRFRKDRGHSRVRSSDK
jgi:hypothetical protein